MADDSELVVPPFENPQGAPPANMPDYDTEVLTPNQQEVLNRLKVNTIRKTHAYLAEKPHVAGMAALLARKVLSCRPRAVLEFMSEHARDPAFCAELVSSRAGDADVACRDSVRCRLPPFAGRPSSSADVGVSGTEREEVAEQESSGDLTTPREVDKKSSVINVISGLRIVERLPGASVAGRSSRGPSTTGVAQHPTEMLTKLSDAGLPEHFAEMLTNLLDASTSDHSAEGFTKLSDSSVTEHSAEI